MNLLKSDVRKRNMRKFPQAAALARKPRYKTGFYANLAPQCFMKVFWLVIILFAAPGAGSGHAVADQPHEIEVALTVDDLPGMGALPAGQTRLGIARDMIRILRTMHIPAYGFANGVQLETDPAQASVLKEWANAGFPIGNHTFSHLFLDQVQESTYAADIARMDRVLSSMDLTGDSLGIRRVFRYPYLSEGNTIAKRNAVRKYLFDNGYRIAEVTVDYHDWAWNDAYTRCLARGDRAGLDQVTKRAADSALWHLKQSVQLSRELFGRDIRHILLLHMGAFEAAEMGANISRYQAAGVRFIALSRAMADPIYAVNPDYAYPGKDMTFLHQIAAARKLAMQPRLRRRSSGYAADGQPMRR